MKESKKLNKLIIMLLLIVCPAVASEPASDLTIANEQIALLKQQVAMMKEHQESLLGTIHWTLGTVITVGIFLIGYNWFSNFKAYERDKEALKATRRPRAWCWRSSTRVRCVPVRRGR